jgi:hypothetical protein
MEAERRKLNGNHILRVGNILTKLLNVQGTTKHPEHMTMRCRGHCLVRVETTVEIRQKGVAAPARDIRQCNVIVQVGKSTLGRAIVSLADIHILVCIVAHG